MILRGFDWFLAPRWRFPGNSEPALPTPDRRRPDVAAAEVRGPLARNLRLLALQSKKPYTRGGMGERLIPAVLKTVVPERVPGVRIPLPPPAFAVTGLLSIAVIDLPAKPGCNPTVTLGSSICDWMPGPVFKW